MKELKQRTAALDSSVKHMADDHEVWLHAFQMRARRAEKEVCSDPSRRDEATCKELMAAIAHAEHKEAASRREALRSELRAHAAEASHHRDDASIAHAAWDHQMQDEATEMRKTLCMDPQRRDRPDCVKFLSDLARQQEQKLEPAVEDSEKWSRDFAHKLWEAEREMCEQPHRRHRADCVALLASIKQKEHDELENQEMKAKSHMEAIEKDHAAWEHKFEDRARQLHKELCQQPERRDRPECVKFLEEETAAEQRALESRAEEDAAWHREFAHSVWEAEREMCKQPHRRHRPDCVKLLASISKQEREELEMQQKAITDAFDAVEREHDEWEHKFDDEAHRLLKEMCWQPERRHRADCVKILEDEANAEMAANEARVAADEEWNRNFTHSVWQAEREMCEQPHRRDRPDCVKLLASIAKKERDEIESHGKLAKEHLDAVKTEHVAWEHTFEDRARQIRFELCQDPSRRDRPDCAEFLEVKADASQAGEISKDSEDWSKQFAHTLWKAEREMCEHPSRKGRPDCMALLASIAKKEAEEAEVAEASASTKAAERAAWSHDFLHKVWKVEKEMCEEPFQRDRPDCVKLLGSIAEAEKKEFEKQNPEPLARASLRATVAREDQFLSPGASHKSVTFSDEQDSPASTSLRGGRQQLRWAGVSSWSMSSWLPSLFGSKQRMILEPQELKAARWAGAIPKVACIAALPFGTVTQAQIRAIVDDFHAQTYEGPAQLVLVYNFQDQDTARLVRIYADGTHIKGVAARDNTELPSTTALRFGAWSAGQDAQVIAHWSLGARHDPERISLQVRALALSARPACLLKREKGTDLADDTLVGETKWMWEHWHPMLNEQRAVLEHLQDADIVQVNAELDHE